MEQNADLTELVNLARAGNSTAYGVIVRRFQDMAYAGGYAWLGDVTKSTSGVLALRLKQDRRDLF